LNDIINEEVNMKILIVEDEKILSNTIKQYLSKKWSIEQAFDGYDGYMLARESIYDAIILDLMMPEMNGYDVLKRLRENDIKTPVLILTAKKVRVRWTNLGVSRVAG